MIYTQEQWWWWGPGLQIYQQNLSTSLSLNDHATGTKPLAPNNYFYSVFPDFQGFLLVYQRLWHPLRLY